MLKKTNKILFLDTSTESVFLGFIENNTLVHHCFFSHKELSDHFLSYVDLFLKDSGCIIEQIDMIACGPGPGYFMGMRVGLAWAQGVCCGLDIPLLGFCSLAAFVAAQEGEFISMIDAKSYGVACLKQKKIADRIEVCGSIELIKDERKLAFLQQFPIVGPKFPLGIIQGTQVLQDMQHVTRMIVAAVETGNIECKPFYPFSYEP